jgi:hypothetical protein
MIDWLRDLPSQPLRLPTALADLYVENMQISRLANVHFGEYI